MIKKIFRRDTDPCVRTMGMDLIYDGSEVYDLPSSEADLSAYTLIAGLFPLPTQ
jgi:hypothetical protein